MAENYGSQLNAVGCAESFEASDTGLERRPEHVDPEQTVNDISQSIPKCKRHADRISPKLNRRRNTSLEIYDVFTESLSFDDA